MNLNSKNFYYDLICNFVHPIVVKKSKENVLFKLCYPEFGFFMFKIKNSKGYVNF